MGMNAIRRCLSVVVVLSAACAQPPASTSLTRPDAFPAKLLSFSGTLQPKGLVSYPFTAAQAGEVEVTLLDVALVGSSSPVTVGLGIGTASTGGACLVTDAVNTQGGPRAQLIGTGQAGTLCISIFDVGYLTGPALYSITVAAP